MGKKFVADPEVGKANVRAALERLENFIDTLATPEGFTKALMRGSRGNLHRYSLRNQALMLLHRGDADHIGTFKYWLARGRMVKKGCGTHLLMPRQFTVKEEVDEETPGAFVDEQGGAYIEKMIRCFKAVTYWDIRDTTDRQGNPYTPPAPRYQPVQGGKPRTPITDTFTLSADEAERAAEIEREVRALVVRTGYTLVDAPYQGAYGVHIRGSRTIQIDPNQDPLKRCGTTTHEAAHMLEYELGTRSTYDLGELVAEGAAFVVLSRYHLDTSGFSFGYVERYGANKQMFRAGVGAIQQISRALIEGIEGETADLEVAA